MANLKCVVENCTYNKDCLCSKGDIMVGGKHACDCDGTCCESFAQKREGRESFSNSLSHPSHTRRSTRFRAFEQFVIKYLPVIYLFSFYELVRGLLN